MCNHTSSWKSVAKAVPKPKTKALKGVMDLSTVCSFNPFGQIRQRDPESGGKFCLPDLPCAAGACGRNSQSVCCPWVNVPYNPVRRFQPNSHEGTDGRR
jgi:hypothetical protein